MRWITLWMVRSALYATTKMRILGVIRSFLARSRGACPTISRAQVGAHSAADANPGQSRIPGAVCREFGDCTRVCPAYTLRAFVVFSKRFDAHSGADAKFEEYPFVSGFLCAVLPASCV